MSPSCDFALGLVYSCYLISVIFCHEYSAYEKTFMDRELRWKSSPAWMIYKYIYIYILSQNIFICNTDSRNFLYGPKVPYASFDARLLTMSVGTTVKIGHKRIARN